MILVEDRLGAVQDGVVDGGGDVEACVAGVGGSQVGERGVGDAGELGQPVVKRVLLVADGLIRGGHGAPDVPGQHLHVVERGQVAQQVGGDPPVAGFVQ